MIKVNINFQRNYIYKFPFSFSVWGQEGNSFVLNSSPESCKEVLCRNIIEYLLTKAPTPYVHALDSDSLKIAIITNKEDQLDLSSLKDPCLRVINSFEEKSNIPKSSAIFESREGIQAILFKSSYTWMSSYLSFSLYLMLLSFGEKALADPTLTLEQLDFSSQDLTFPLNMTKKDQLSAIIPYIEVFYRNFDSIFKESALVDEKNMEFPIACTCEDGIISLIKNKTKYKETKKLMEAILCKIHSKQ